MKRGMVVWLLLAVISVPLALWAYSSLRALSGSHDRYGAASSIETTAQSDTGDGVTAQPGLSSIRPRQASIDRSYGLTEEDYTAVLEASGTEQPFDALRELADAGNSMAAKDLGDRLIGCRAGALQDTDDEVGRIMAQLSWAQRELEAAKASSSPSAALEALATRAHELRSRVASETAQADADRARCRDLSPEQAWQGFDWLDRAVAMGYEPARASFIRTVARTFSKPQAVGRNPRKAMELRDRARSYLSQMMQECDKSSLWLYAWAMPTLYPLGDERRLAAGQIAMYSIETSQKGQAYVESMKKRFEIDDLQSRLSASQIASAKKQAAALRARCLGSNAQ